MTKRASAVAGRFYPSRPGELSALLDSFLETAHEKEKAIAAVCPHAGYAYSGRVAGQVYSRLHMPRKIVLLGPNHTGAGPRLSVMAEGGWEVPNGFLPVDEELAGRIIGEEKEKTKTPLFTRDETAHRFEHSLEVQLPFIARLRPDAAIVPVTMFPAPPAYLEKAGRAIAGAISAEKEEVLIIVSSDMSHYVPEAVAREKDRLAINRVLELDPEGLMETVTQNRISMCGYAPAIVMLHAARMLGARAGRLVSYDTSASAGGDAAHVVGYAGIIIK